MDPSVARSFEAVTVAARRLRAHLRYEGVTIEGSVKTATFSAPIWMIRDLADSLDNSEVVRADAHIDEVRVRRERTPTSLAGWARRRGMRKVNLPRETLDE